MRRGNRGLEALLPLQKCWGSGQRTAYLGWIGCRDWSLEGRDLGSGPGAGIWSEHRGSGRRARHPFRCIVGVGIVLLEKKIQMEGRSHKER